MDEHQQQFGVRPFVAGAVRGVRTFRLHDCGGNCGTPFGLRSVSAFYGWVPGENLAACTPPFMTTFMISAPAAHQQVAGMGCSCGFYAYFGDSNDYEQSLTFDPMVAGVIEAYGVVTVGNRGFRAEKARIVALAWTSASGPRTEKLAAELARFGVPVYDSTAEMLAEHPTTQPQDVGVEPPKPEDQPVRSNFAQGGVIVYGGRAFQFAAGQFQAALQQVQASIDDAKAAPDAATAHAAPAAGAVAQIRSLARRSIDRARGGLVYPGVQADSITPPGRRAPVKSRSQLAAEARQAAGLRGVGGFDRRGRRR